MIFLDVRLILDLEHEGRKIVCVQWRIIILRIDAHFGSPHGILLRISPRVIRRSCRRASSDLSGFASGYCGSLIYDEDGMRKEFIR